MMLNFKNGDRVALKVWSQLVTATVVAKGERRSWFRYGVNTLDFGGSFTVVKRKRNSKVVRVL
jgi:hypothetical protein